MSSLHFSVITGTNKTFSVAFYSMSKETKPFYDCVSEHDASCSCDQKGFKVIYAQNLAYLHWENNNSTKKWAIEKVINCKTPSLLGFT
jgi:hypothetical protein